MTGMDTAKLNNVVDTCTALTDDEWLAVSVAIRTQRRRNQEARREKEADDLTTTMDMTPEGYVREWDKHGRRNITPLQAWEWAYQRAGLIEQAARKGLIEIGRDMACTVTLTERGESLISS